MVHDLRQIGEVHFGELVLAGQLFDQFGGAVVAAFLIESGELLADNDAEVFRHLCGLLRLRIGVRIGLIFRRSGFLGLGGVILRLRGFGALLGVLGRLLGVSLGELRLCGGLRLCLSGCCGEGRGHDAHVLLELVQTFNTGFYQSDFDIDKEIIAKAAASPNREDKTLLWFCRPMGTHCFRERDVFLKDTAPHNTWRFYMEQTSDRILAYAIELTGKERGKIKGNLYELDYARHYERVKDRELAADTVRLVYEHGTRDIPAGQYFTGNPDTVYGKFERFEAIPNDPDALQFLLQEEKRSREQLTPGDFKVHIAALHDGLIETEARRIVGEMKRRDTPNSPNKTHFMAELSTPFMQLANTKDLDRLFSMLPYKTLSFSKIEGRHGTYALIDKGENRDKEIRKARPSIRAQLKADKEKTTPKKAAAKSKNHDLEV